MATEKSQWSKVSFFFFFCSTTLRCKHSSEDDENNSWFQSKKPNINVIMKTIQSSLLFRVVEVVARSHRCGENNSSFFMKPPFGNSDMCFTSFGRTSVNSASKPQKLVQTGGDHTTSCLNGMWLCVWGPTMCSWHHYEVVIQISSMCLCAAVSAESRFRGYRFISKCKRRLCLGHQLIWASRCFFFMFTQDESHFQWCYFTSPCCKYPWNDSDFIQNDTSHCLSFSFYFFKVCWWSFCFYWTKTAGG